MPRPKINGTLSKVRKSVKTRFDRSNGLVTQVEWASAGDNLGGYARALRNLGIQYEHTATGAVSTLIETADGATAGVQDVVTDRWEVLSNENMLDLKEHSKWPTLTDQTQYLILKDVQRHANGKKPTFEFLTTEPTDDGKALATAFYDLMIRGVTHFPVYNWVLRHTTNAPQDFEENIADSGVGTVYTTSQLVDEITNSSFWFFPCPPRLRRKIENITIPAQAGFTAGWLKKPSNESTGANSRIEISTEYVFAGWSNLIYF